MKNPRPNYVIPFPDFWDEEMTTFTEDGIVFTSELINASSNKTQSDSSYPGDYDTIPDSQEGYHSE